MRLALIIAVTLVGVGVTVLAAVRLWTASKDGAPHEQQVGYVAMMLAASAVSLLLLRAL